jgi:hypothetical protein
MKYKNLLYISTLAMMASCGTRYYTPSVKPTGKSELTRKQIRRDFTN